jgi:dTMP kinase
LFIVLEGIDGCGKSIQLSKLKTYMEQRGRKVLLVNDPGTTEVGVAIRKLLLDGELPMPPAVQALLYTAARLSLAEHIRDSHRSGHDVLCGRWALSTMVYQGLVQNVGLGHVQRLHQEWVGFDPDVYLVLDLPAETARHRLHADTGKRFVDVTPAGSEGSHYVIDDEAPEFSPDRDRFESKPLQFTQRLRDCYAQFGETITYAGIVDAAPSPEEVFRSVLAVCASKSARFAKIYSGSSEPDTQQ